MIDQLRAAAEALNLGDPEPFASLFAEDAEWRGISHGFLWWKQTPTCRGPDEARDVLKFQMPAGDSDASPVYASVRECLLKGCRG